MRKGDYERDHAADLRRHADEAIMREVDFVPDPFDAEARRVRLNQLEPIAALNGRKKPTGVRARKSLALYHATGDWIR